MAWSSPRRSSTSSCIYWWFQQPSLVNWSELNNTYLVFDAKDHATFHSAAWKQDYNPDLCFVPVNEANNRPLPASRKVIFNFPRSQHRPVIVEIGLSIPIVTSYPRPRWNFMKADWKKYSENLDKVLGWIPPLSENYDRLCKAIIQNQNQVCGICADMLFKWGKIDSPECDCGAERQTIRHIVEHCPLRSYSGNMQDFLTADDCAISYVNNLNLKV